MRSALVVVVGALVFAAAAFGTTRLAGATTNVAVTAGKPSELRFTLSKRTVPRGTVVFKVTNRGKSRHDFKIAGKKTKLLAPGATATLRVAIARAGRYAYLCTVPGHAAAGMKGTLRVT
jgi:uncharacterized cupredoxin-like copper-binding protein